MHLHTMEVRRDAIGTLMVIARKLDKPCPLVMIEMLEDKEDEVRWTAGVDAGLFKTFAPGSVTGRRALSSTMRGSCWDAWAGPRCVAQTRSPPTRR